ncbi:MAG: hypothetical protein WC855_05430 [Thermodesulfovibrionales bacterium]
MTELIVALIMAFLTGITILAHKYPHAYEKLTLPSMIFNSGFTVLIAGFAWFAAVNNAYNTSLQFIPPEKQVAALKAIEGIKPSSHYIFFFVAAWVGLWFYSIFLALLPCLLKKES